MGIDGSSRSTEASPEMAVAYAACSEAVTRELKGSCGVEESSGTGLSDGAFQFALRWNGFLEPERLSAFLDQGNAALPGHVIYRDGEISFSQSVEAINRLADTKATYRDLDLTNPVHRQAAALGIF